MAAAAHWCMNGWMWGLIVKRFEYTTSAEKRYISAVHLDGNSPCCSKSPHDAMLLSMYFTVRMVFSGLQLSSKCNNGCYDQAFAKCNLAFLHVAFGAMVSSLPSGFSQHNTRGLVSLWTTLCHIQPASLQGVLLLFWGWSLGHNPSSSWVVWWWSTILFLISWLISFDFHMTSHKEAVCLQCALKKTSTGVPSINSNVVN